LKNLEDDYFDIKNKLIHWYNDNKRDLPWRNTKNPYHIWLSEIILQQTRVNQGLSYYFKFIDHYPSVQDLAQAKEEEVLKDWQGLGYYSRARNLHATAQYISQQLQGKFPDNYSDILQLKGVGEYTAAAIASFAYDLPHAVVDGNVFRVLSRLFGEDTAIDTSVGKKKFNTIASQLMDEKRPAKYNQAIMEFGAIQCVPSSPNCSQCIFNTQCYAYKTNTIDSLPVKEKKIKQRKRFLHYLILEDEEHLVVHKREQNGIWKNLFDFPCIEANKEINWSQLQKNDELHRVLKEDTYHFLSESASQKHILSHQILYARFFHFRSPSIAKTLKKQSDYQIIRKEILHKLPIPKLIENYLNQETNFLSLSL
jgi:A/G-specific adenine glycosylase